MWSDVNQYQKQDPDQELMLVYVLSGGSHQLGQIQTRSEKIKG